MSKFNFFAFGVFLFGVGFHLAAAQSFPARPVNSITAPAAPPVQTPDVLPPAPQPKGCGKDNIICCKCCECVNGGCYKKGPSIDSSSGAAQPVCG